MAGHVQRFLAVSLLVSSNRQKKFQVFVSLKGKNGTFVSLTVFSVYFKVTVINDINLINCVNCFFLTHENKFSLTVCQIVNGGTVNGCL